MATETKKTNWIIYAIIGIVIIAVIAYLYYSKPVEETAANLNSLPPDLPKVTEPELIGNTLFDGPKITIVNDTNNTGINNA